MADTGTISHASISKNVHSIVMYICTNFGATMADTGTISHASISKNVHSTVMYICTNFGAFITK